MTITEAIKLTRDDRSEDRRRFFDVGRACEFELPAWAAPVYREETLYFAQQFGFTVCPREDFSRRRGEAIAYGALREGIISAAYVRLLQLFDNIKLA